MPTHPSIKLLLAAASLLAGQRSWAQRAAVAPLAPLPPVVRPVVPALLPQVGAAEAHKPNLAPAVATPPPPAPRSWSPPVYLLNSRVIVHELAVINPQDISDIHVYKGADAPARWHSLTEHGIIDVTLKPGQKLKLPTKSLATIRRQLKVTGLVRFQLGSLRMEDATLRVATGSVAGFDTLRSAAETVIIIYLAPPTPAPPLPPGSVRIRGVAGR